MRATLAIRVRRSLRRSKHRHPLLVALAALGTSTAADLGRLTGIDRARVVAALEGRHPLYRVDEAPVALGLVRVASFGGPRAYRITALGLRVAREGMASVDRLRP